MKKEFSLIVVSLLLESIVATAFSARIVKAETITVPIDYPTIQQAINAATSGDIINISSGTYYENIVVNKTVSLIGESRETTFIYGNGGRIAVYVKADGVVITGFTVESSGGSDDDGIDLDNVENCDVFDSNIVSSFFGIGLFSCLNCSIHDNHVWKNQYGIGGASSSDCSVRWNEVTDNENGIAIDMSSFIEMKGNKIARNQYGIVCDYPESNNHIVDNNITNNHFGIRLLYDNNDSITGNCITGNTIVGNQYGILQRYSPHMRIAQNNISRNICGVKLESSLEDNTITNNSIINNSLYGIWFSSSSSNSITDNNIVDNGFGVMLANSSNNTITDNVFVNDGMFVSESFKNTVDNNLVNGKPLFYLEDASDYTVENAGQVILVACNRIRVVNLKLTKTTVGLQMWVTNNSLITGNDISENMLGIYLHSCSNNTIYHNNFMNNTNQATAQRSTNFWNNSIEGNYWSDYTGVDLDHNGIGDSPYVIFSTIDQNQDNYPLMKPYLLGDYNHDGTVNMTDVNLVRLAWQSRIGESNYNPQVDFNMDGIIDIKDAAVIGVNWLKTL